MDYSMSDDLPSSQQDCDDIFNPILTSIALMGNAQHNFVEGLELSVLKRRLAGWREALLPIRSLLTWEKPHHPLILFGVTTLVFPLIWSLEPSVVTTFAILGLVITTVDFAVPLVSPYLFSKVQWTEHEERQFEEVCERILHIRTHLSDFVQGMIILKKERPKIYFFLVLVVLTIFAWIGYKMNNLFLSYVLVLTVLMMPGLRQKGLLPAVWTHGHQQG